MQFAREFDDRAPGVVSGERREREREMRDERADAPAISHIDPGPAISFSSSSPPPRPPRPPPHESFPFPSSLLFLSSVLAQETVVSFSAAACAVAAASISVALLYSLPSNQQHLTLNPLRQRTPFQLYLPVSIILPYSLPRYVPSDKGQFTYLTPRLLSR